MSKTELRQRANTHLCGLGKWHPAWLQQYATTKTFMGVYGLLGTIQAMSYMYFVVTLTTVEKRFKIPSQTTGIILSGNEISQILLSLILSYIGGQRNRPRWIAWGIVLSGLSCYIIALPHFIYGAGEDTLRFTKEYIEMELGENATSTLPFNSSSKTSQQLCGALKLTQECDALLSVVPLVLIFLSQFVVGIGNTLYYSLGQTYLDDNTKKTNTPLMLAIAMSLRMIGPIVGFVLGYAALNMFIDPTKTPLIDNADPRWLGAWWFGWTILGTLMIMFSGLIALFPKQLPKRKSLHYNSNVPHVLRHDEIMDEGVPLGKSLSSNATLDTLAAGTADFPKLKDFPKALMRLLRNKLLIFNIVSAIFYILGAAGYMTFLTKYMEVQFHKTAQSATIIVGPVSIIGMVVGLIGSGLVISKKMPSPSKVLMWNVFVGCIYIVGQISYMFLYCPDTVSILNDGKLNVSSECNANCACEDVRYSPVCHENTKTTFFSPCHAGCQSWDSNEKIYSNCSCLATDFFGTFTTSTSKPMIESEWTTEAERKLPKILKSLLTTTTTTTTTTAPITPLVDLSTMPSILTTANSFDEPTTSFTTFEGPSTLLDSEELLTRTRRAIEEVTNTLKPGVCLKGCNTAFYTFAITSLIVNWFGSSGRIGNLLVNYRAVATEDKAFAQGLTLMLISLFALIPGPIIFGRLIDSTCLVWTQTCRGKGNCQLYDQTSFRYLVNSMAFSFTLIGVLFDVLVWYHGRHLDLYGKKETQHLEELRRKHKPITPLLARTNASTEKA